MERLSGLDACFLYLDTPDAPFHIGLSATFDASTSPRPYDFARVVDLVDSRLHLLPPFRRRLTVPLRGWAPPVWVEDADFDIANHVEGVTVRGAITDKVVAALTADALRPPLDRS